MAKVKYLDQHGLQTVVSKIKRLTTGVYTVKGRAIYADATYLADANKEQDIDEAGLWQQVAGVWTKITAFNEGEVYDIINQFVTDANGFIEGAGKTVPGGTNIVVVNVGTAGSPVLKFDLFSGVLSLDEYQTKALVDTLAIYVNETPTVYTDSASLPSSEAVASATITDGMIAVIGTGTEAGDVYKAAVAVNATDSTLNDITWTKLGNQGTVEGAIALVANTAPNTPITAAEIEAMFANA